MATDLLEKLRQMLLDMHHSGRLSHIEPGLYEDARAYVEKLKADYYGLKNPLESRAGSLLIEEIGSVTDTVQEIFSVRTRQILDLAFQQMEGQYTDKEEARKMLPAERAMYGQIIDAIEGCREALVHGETYPFGSDGAAAVDRLDEVDGIPASEVPAAPAPRPVQSPYALVHILSDMESFMGVDGRTYALERGDIVTLPENNADVLCEHDIALNIRLNK
ncbi:DNA replication complex GINS family protein [Methanoculleus sp.]|uniref:DNA replication complex GINS family protein n=1 Tax=Methanoculleus sp. TaxID=90427 RepID=UPI001BD34097|nr:DNA replication complex GINS family protein [Methanoculleus sp.]